MPQENPMPAGDLAERLRWLADQWRSASPELRKKIEVAFKRGQEKGLER